MTTSAQDVQESLSHTLEAIRFWTSELVLEGDVTRAEMGLSLVRLIEEKIAPQAEKMGLAPIDKRTASTQYAVVSQLRNQPKTILFVSPDSDNKKIPLFLLSMTG